MLFFSLGQSSTHLTLAADAMAIAIYLGAMNLT